MKIKSYTEISPSEFLSRLKQTRLKGFDQAYVYRDAKVELVEAVDPSTLAPAQRYVLREGYRTIERLYHLFLELGVNIFALKGALQFVPESADGDEEAIPLAPPVVEESQEPDGSRVWLINDGIHRVYAAMKLGLPINVALVRDVPKEYPYYAYALERGWDEVEELDELPDNYLKKTYRDPKNYKSLFRDFNELFPGIQKQRKKSNPKDWVA